MPAFFFNDTATTEIYTLSLHDALPISQAAQFSDYVWDHLGCDVAAASGLGGGRISHRAAAAAIAARHGSGLRFRRARFLDLGGRADRDRKSTRLKSSPGYNSYARFFF